MAEVLIVADDLTGANACAAGFSRAGLRAVTVGLDREFAAITEFHSQFDVVVATSESRHAPHLEAAIAVREAVAAGWPVKLACTRIDTTLRGNVGVAAQGLIDTVAELSGKRAVGLCVPAFPSAGRVTVDGHQLLQGRRLETTELAYDVRSPMTTSNVADILRTNTMLSVVHVPISVVTGDEEELVTTLAGYFSDRLVDVVVGDALTDEHITHLATAAVKAAERADVHVCGIDPGPASLALAKAMGLTQESGSAPILVMSGSSTDTTISQLAHLADKRNVELIPSILDGDMPDVEANIKAVADALNSRTKRVVVWASVLQRSDIRKLSDDDALSLPSVIGSIARGAMTEAAVDGLYTTGGDITAAVLSALGARGIEVEDEVLPLAVAGSIVGGNWQGTPIVTKGGLIGDETAALTCVDYLDQASAQRARWVRTISR